MGTVIQIRVAESKATDVRKMAFVTLEYSKNIPIIPVLRGLYCTLKSPLFCL